MDFREEYKKSAEKISPDQEAVDRMKAAVMARLSEESISSVPERKKPKLKRIAFIGGAAAACAVITVSAVRALPSHTKDTAGEAFMQSPHIENSLSGNGNIQNDETIINDCLPESGIITDDALSADTAAGITGITDNPTEWNAAADSGAYNADEMYDEEYDVEEDAEVDDSAPNPLEADGNRLTYCGIIYTLADDCEPGSIADPIYEPAECMADGKQYDVLLNTDRSILELYSNAGDFLGTYVLE